MSRNWSPLQITLLVCGICGAVFLGALVIGVFWLGSEMLKPMSAEERAAHEASQAAKDLEADHTVSAWIEAKDVIESKLLAPASAEFPSLGWDVGAGAGRVSTNAALWVVHGYVDAQNLYGAKIRSHWAVLLRRTNQAWAVEMVELDHRSIASDRGQDF